MRYDDDAFNKCIPFTNSKYILTEKNDATTSKTLHLILVSSVAVIFLTPAKNYFPIIQAIYTSSMTLSSLGYHPAQQTQLLPSSVPPLFWLKAFQKLQRSQCLIEDHSPDLLLDHFIQTSIMINIKYDFYRQQAVTSCKAFSQPY